jgi:hypothetical protein
LVGDLINGHYRHQQTMAQLDGEFRLEKARIEQDTQIKLKQVDAALQYGLAQINAQMEKAKYDFKLLVKNLDLSLEDSRVLQQHITQSLTVATQSKRSPRDAPPLILESILPSLFAAQQAHASQRHELLLQHLNKPITLAAPDRDAF